MSSRVGANVQMSRCGGRMRAGWFQLRGGVTPLTLWELLHLLTEASLTKRAFRITSISWPVIHLDCLSINEQIVGEFGPAVREGCLIFFLIRVRLR